MHGRTDATIETAYPTQKRVVDVGSMRLALSGYLPSSLSLAAIMQMWIYKHHQVSPAQTRASRGGWRCRAT